MRMPTRSWSEAFFQALQYSEPTEALARYWHDLPRRGENIVPHRSDFKLHEIAGHLDETYMSKFCGPEELIILASGSVLVRLLGADITGKNIFKLVPQENYQQQVDYYQKLKAQPCAGALTRWGASLKGRPFVYRTMQLPLLGDTNEVEFFVGTGVIRTSHQLGDQLSVDEKVHVEQHEQVFINIGAGVPDTP